MAAELCAPHLARPMLSAGIYSSGCTDPLGGIIRFSVKLLMGKNKRMRL